MTGLKNLNDLQAVHDALEVAVVDARRVLDREHERAEKVNDVGAQQGIGHADVNARQILIEWRAACQLIGPLTDRMTRTYERRRSFEINDQWVARIRESAQAQLEQHAAAMDRRRRLIDEHNLSGIGCRNSIVATLTDPAARAVETLRTVLP